MGFFNSELPTVSVLLDNDEKSVHYSFMERGDLVYYREPETGSRIMATIIDFTCDDRGQPDEVTISLSDGTWIETSIRNITY